MSFKDSKGMTTLSSLYQETSKVETCRQPNNRQV